MGSWRISEPDVRSSLEAVSYPISTNAKMPSSSFTRRPRTPLSTTVPSGRGHALRSALHGGLFLEAVDIAIDGGDGQHLAALPVAHHAVAPLDVALDVELVPLLGVADVVDRHVVVLAPEERHLG